MSMCRIISSTVEENVCYDLCILLAKLCQPLPHFILYPKTKLACYSMYLLTSYFCISVPYDEKVIFFSVSYRRSCRSSQNHSASASLALAVGAQTWLTVTLNGFLWKQIEIVLSFLRLHPPSTAFQTLVDYEGQSHLQEKEMQKGKTVSEQALQIAEKIREANGNGEKERYAHLNAVPKNSKERLKKPSSAINSNIEKNNAMANQSYLQENQRYQRNISCKDGHNKGRNCM